MVSLSLTKHHAMKTYWESGGILREIGWEGVNWIHLAQDRGQ
jgi:hypothetical protein